MHTERSHRNLSLEKMTICAVNGCHNSSEKLKKDSKITFHSFPADPDTVELWIEKLRKNRNDYSWKPTKHTKICSIHFADEDKYVTDGGYCKIRRGAIPTKAVIPTYYMEWVLKSPIESQSGDVNHTSETNSGTPSGNISPKSPLNEDHSRVHETPKTILLRKDLNKKILLQRKYRSKIKALQQKNRRLIKTNASLENSIKRLRSERLCCTLNNVEEYDEVILAESECDDVLQTIMV